jgi:hypothetical protein
MSSLAPQDKQIAFFLPDKTSTYSSPGRFGRESSKGRKDSIRNPFARAIFCRAASFPAQHLQRTSRERRLQMRQCVFGVTNMHFLSRH